MRGICLAKAASASESGAWSGLGGIFRGTTSGLKPLPCPPTWGEKENKRKRGPPDLSLRRKQKMFGLDLPTPPSQRGKCPHFQVLMKQDVILRKHLPKLQAIRNASMVCNMESGKETLDRGGRAGARKGTWFLFQDGSLDFQKAACI